MNACSPLNALSFINAPPRSFCIRCKTGEAARLSGYCPSFVHSGVLEDALVISNIKWAYIVVLTSMPCPLPEILIPYCIGRSGLQKSSNVSIRLPAVPTRLSFVVVCETSFLCIRISIPVLYILVDQSIIGFNHRTNIINKCMV